MTNPTRDSIYLLHTHTTLFLDDIASVRWRGGDGFHAREAVVALKGGGGVLVSGGDVRALYDTLRAVEGRV